MGQDFLARIPIFEDLDEADREIVARLWRPRALQPGELLFHRSDPGDSMFLIEEGTLEVMIPAQVGAGEVAVSTLHAGDFVGELALLSGMPRTATARAVEPTRVLEMTRGDFMGFLEKRPRVAISMLSEMGRRLRHTNELIMSLTSKNVNEQLEGQMTLGDRVADRVAEFGGSWAFIFSFGAILFGWMGINVIHYMFLPFDPFPFIFLNLMLSTLAAIQAPVIMMSQNRAQKKDRLKADLDYASGVKSELMLQSLHGKIDEIRELVGKRREFGAADSAD
jgi:uncharacterized membrane protein